MGSDALEAGRFEEGVRLTLAGLEQPNNPRDQAAGHSNICAGYAALKRWTEALEHCNRALELDRSNWRTFNNRAAVFVGLKKYDLAMTDVNSGLELSPNSSTLLKSREVVKQHHDAAGRERWRKPSKA
jgi:tetratricopeptide (TPR) repeat protein